MTHKTASLVAEIHATKASTLHHELNAAVDRAQDKAIREGRRGIMVTRHGYTHFTVELSPEVPYGLTQERQAW